MINKNIVKSLLYGVCIGDALGVPVEFVYRAYLNEYPVKDMLGGGIHGQEKGVWSDDSALTFCLAEAIVEGYNLKLLAEKIIAWKYYGYWTATGEIFDIGNATNRAITNLVNGINPIEAGGKNENDNGNGSLMRVLPLIVLLKDLPITDRFKLTKEVSSLTHAHPRSVMACFYYLEFALELINGKEKFNIYQELKIKVYNFFIINNDCKEDLHHFNKLFNENIFELEADVIMSTGYVVHTLEASIWCLLTTNTYQEAVLKAVNLGEDTDTTGAVTGGLAGLLYGYESIPKDWISTIKGKNDIDNLINKF
jgi:ADP-ribosyl-[dinitrogen reductase] hydrolase